MKYDYATLYNKNADFYNARPQAKKALRLVNGLLTYAFFLAYAGLWAYGIFLGDFLPNDFLKIFFVPVSALFLVSLLRLGIARPRPYAAKGAGITPLVLRSGREDDSCPSRHLTCAAVIAMTFLPYLPVVGYVLLVSTFLLAYTRFALGMHYPSDLLAGIGVGGAVGALVFWL